MEISIDGRIANVQELSRDGNIITMMVDDEIYEIDALRVADGIYSLLYKGRSYNIEMIADNTARHYTVNSWYNTYKVEVIDAQTRYKMSREKGAHTDEGNMIISPMPGKVVKLLCQEGDEVETGQTLIIISAMKMESEFKAKVSGTIKQITVKEGDTIDANKILITINPTK
ncbi:MAG: biotin/lipoyl-containing protein [Chloroflexota bacterium]|nr:biotin/lipoyl-containing protein [Lentimicrobium sp.]